MKPKSKIEAELRSYGYKHIAGTDEAGRGSWAGPIMAGAVILPDKFDLPDLKDSKQLTPKKRDQLFDQITEVALDWAVGQVSNTEIDRIGIGPANKLAIKLAVSNLKKVQPHYVLVDHWHFADWQIEHQGITKGDRDVACIAAASIIAKVTRDRWMVSQHKQFPEYCFDQHKGYGTQKHRQAISQHGICKLHRCSFKPIQEKGLTPSSRERMD